MRGLEASEGVLAARRGSRREHAAKALVHPKLTTVHMNVIEMGYQAADLMLKLLDRLASGKAAEPAHVTVPVKLVMRESA